MAVDLRILTEEVEPVFLPRCSLLAAWIEKRPGIYENRVTGGYLVRMLEDKYPTGWRMRIYERHEGRLALIVQRGHHVRLNLAASEAFEVIWRRFEKSLFARPSGECRPPMQRYLAWWLASYGKRRTPPVS